MGKISSDYHNTNFKGDYDKIRLITLANIKNKYVKLKLIMNYKK